MTPAQLAYQQEVEAHARQMYPERFPQGPLQTAAGPMGLGAQPVQQYQMDPALAQPMIQPLNVPQTMPAGPQQAQTPAPTHGMTAQEVQQAQPQQADYPTAIEGEDIPHLRTYNEMLNAATIAKQTGNRELAERVMQSFGTGEQLRDVQPEGWRDLFTGGHHKRAADKLRKTIGLGAGKAADPLLGRKAAKLDAQIDRLKGQERRDVQEQPLDMQAKELANHIAGLQKQYKDGQITKQAVDTLIARIEADNRPEVIDRAKKLSRAKATQAYGQARQARATAAQREADVKARGPQERVKLTKAREWKARQPSKGININLGGAREKAKIRRAEAIRKEIRQQQSILASADAWKGAAVPSWIELSRTHKLDPDKAEALAKKVLDEQQNAGPKAKAAQRRLKELAVSLRDALEREKQEK